MTYKRSKYMYNRHDDTTHHIVDQNEARKPNKRRNRENRVSISCLHLKSQISCRAATSASQGTSLSKVVVTMRGVQMGMTTQPKTRRNRQLKIQLFSISDSHFLSLSFFN